MYSFKNKKEALDVLECANIMISGELDEILLPKWGQFDDFVHDAIDYLLESHDFSVKYI